MGIIGTRAEINLNAAAHNIRELRRITSPKANLMAVVKANGYGHGAVKHTIPIGIKAAIDTENGGLFITEEAVLGK